MLKEKIIIRGLLYPKRFSREGDEILPFLKISSEDGLPQENPEYKSTSTAPFELAIGVDADDIDALLELTKKLDSKC